MPQPEPVPDLTLEERERTLAIAGAIEQLLDTLPAAYRDKVLADLQRTTWTPDPYPVMEYPARAYFMASVISALTFAVVEMALGRVDGWYSGPARFPLIVCEAYDHYRSDQRSTHRHGHVMLPEFEAAHGCPLCGFRWLNHQLRETLDTCPACERVWPPFVGGHQRSVLIGARKWMQIPADATEDERRRVGTQSVARMGEQAAREWLTDALELPPAVVEATITAGRDAA